MGGRPPSLATYIRLRTNDGKDIVDFLLRVVDDELYPKRRVRPTDRIEAVRLLVERGWGRVPLADGDGEQPQVIIVQMKGDY